MQAERNEDGVKIIYLEESDCIDKKVEEKKFLGQWIGEDDADLIVDFDVDVYSPPDVFGERKLLIAFRKNVFSKEVTEAAYKGLRKAAVRSENRGIAAGPRDTNAPRDWVLDENGKPTGKVYLKSTGEISDTQYANPVDSGLAGYFDRYVRIPYCRQTSYTKQKKGMFEKAIPFLQGISDQFRKLNPERWQNQKDMIDKTSQEFVIDGTVFTTITVNKNFRTAGHRDAGDLKEGFGNLTVLTNGVKYSGGYTVLPRYRIGVDVEEGDVFLFDVHEIHGNTPLEGPEDEDGKPKYERVSVVCYYREKMNDCSNKIYEDTRYNFLEERRKDPDHPDRPTDKDPSRAARWNGIVPGVWKSEAWFEYLMNNGLEEYAREDFPEKFDGGAETLEEFF